MTCAIGNERRSIASSEPAQCLYLVFEPRVCSWCLSLVFFCIISQRAPPILEEFPQDFKVLLVRQSSQLVLDLGFHILDGLRLKFHGCGLAMQGLT